MNSTRLLTLVATVVVSLIASSAYGQTRSSRLSGSTTYDPDGVLEPWKISDVACAESGIVGELHVRIGQAVKVGQALASLNSQALKVQLEIAEAQARSVGRESSARSDVQLNRRKVEAIRAVREQQFSSQMELERAVAELQISEGRLVAEQEEREVLRLQVERLRQQLAERTVFAPIDGMVVEVHKQLGEFVAPNSPQVVRIVDVSRLRASFFLRLEEVDRLRQTTQAKVRLMNGKTIEADIESIAPFAESESGLIEVRVLINNPKRDIRSSHCTLILNPTP